MGTVALVGAVVITVGSIGWYLLYVRPRISREGVAADAVRRRVGRDALTDTESAMNDSRREVLVPLTKSLDERRERSLVALAADLVRADDGRVVAVRFEEVPDQAPLTEDVTAQSAADVSFESRLESLSAELGVDVEADEVVSHDTKHAIVNFAADRGVDTIVAEHEPLRLRSRLVGDPIDWVVRHAPCDVLLVDNLGYDEPKRVALVGENVPYAPLSVNVAQAIAAANGGTVSLRSLPRRDETDQYRRTVDDYQTELSELLGVRVESVRTDGGEGAVPDVLVRPGRDDGLRGVLDTGRDVPNPGCTAVTAYPHDPGPGLGRRVLERLTF
jgi:nucleotide-binding universal stress UspA family protein